MENLRFSCLNNNFQQNKMKTIVVSAVNLNIGGTLTILRECLSYLSSLAKGGDYRIVALVHKKELALYDNIEYIEIPWSKKRWTNRLWCEYVTMRKISKELAPITLWLSLHDTTPNVIAEKQAVYCHNPFPFFKWRWKDLLYNYKIVLFAWFSYFIYRINIKKNDYVIVQQEWIRKAFEKMLPISRSKIIVAPPKNEAVIQSHNPQEKKGTFTFLYASSPNVHKNFEQICRASQLLEATIGKAKFKVVLTVKGTENMYAQWLHEQWGNVDSIVFHGFMDKKTLYQHYATADCLIFPSRIETWGLPISEYAPYNKPMLLADLPYAYETAAGSRHTAFYNPEKPEELKVMMQRLIDGDTSFLKEVEKQDLEEPKAENWRALFEQLTKSSGSC